MKTEIEIKVKLTLELKKDQSVFDALHEMDCKFKLFPRHGQVVDSEIIDYQNAVPADDGEVDFETSRVSPY